MACDLCGRESSLIRTKIEGVILNVCNSCSKHGKVLEAPVKTKFNIDSQIVRSGMPVYEEIVVENYNKLVKDAREKLGFNHKELSQKVAERESIISKIETKNMIPDLVLAKKLQRVLNVKLIEKVEI